MKKSELNGSMLFKMRNDRLCALLMDYEGDFILYDKDDITSGYSEGTIMFEDYDDELDSPSSRDYDIMSIKQRNSCVRVISDVLNDISVDDWDWTREIKKPEPKPENTVQNITINISIDSKMNIDDIFAELNKSLEKRHFSNLI